MHRLVILLALAACARKTEDGTYAGRKIAPTCLGADWLERPDRETREEPDRMLDALHLDASMTVADVGAGTGYITRRLAKRVAKVYATDVQPEMIEKLRAGLGDIANVTAIVATDHDARLPVACCDLVILVDVYHELADPAGVMRGVKAALAPRGRLVLVEYRGEDPDVPIKPEHKMTLPQVRSELEALGFRFVESLEMLSDQHVIIFTR